MIIQAGATTVDAAALKARTGWELKPEGLCQGDICVPTPESSSADAIELVVLQNRLGMPLVVDDATGVGALGPAALGRSLATAEAPELILPDLDGNLFRLGSLRGRKVLLVAWASW